MGIWVLFLNNMIMIIHAHFEMPPQLNNLCDLFYQFGIQIVKKKIQLNELEISYESARIPSSTQRSRFYRPEGEARELLAKQKRGLFPERLKQS